jgi:hypothetical protein
MSAPSGQADGAPQQQIKNGFLNVEPVFSLLKDHRIFRIHHLVSNLFAAVSRQAVHKDRMRRGLGHEFLVDLIGLEEFGAFCRLMFLPHAGPGIRVDGIDTRDRNLRIRYKLQLRPRLLG